MDHQRPCSSDLWLKRLLTKGKHSNYLVIFMRCVGRELDEFFFEKTCDIIFSLIPRAPPLKQLFLNWSQLNPIERARFDVKIRQCCCPRKRQLYKSLREAMIRWENIQDTEGAPGCEPAMIPPCFSQLEKELGNLVCNLETFLVRKYENKYDPPNRRRNSTPLDSKRETCMLLSRCKDYCRFIGNTKARSLRRVHSWASFVDSKIFEEELNGYLTN